MNGMFAAVALASTLLAQVAFAADAAPQWNSKYGEAYYAGKKAQRPVLIVIDKPADAAAIKPVAYVNKDVSAEEAALLANFELCHVDASTEYGQDVAKRFGATKFPYVAITDSKVEVLRVQHTGEMSQPQWVATLAKYSKAEKVENTTNFSMWENSGSYCPSCRRR
jgi:hypothetical protein